MLCYKCLHQVPDNSEACPFCGQKLKPSTKKDTTPLSTQKKEAGEESDITMILKPSAQSPLPLSREFQIGDTIIDRYEVREVFTHEGLFYSYKVRDKKEKRTKVLKLLSASFIEESVITRFRAVFQNIKNIEHRGIVQIYEIMDIEGLPFFTMEYLEGLDFRKLLAVRSESNQYFTLSEAESIVTSLIETIEFIHSKNMLHGDLKPENILILPDTLKITDMGIYRLLEPREFISLQLAMGDAYYYLAPEFITQQGELTPASDVYSIGIILYEMFTGVIPKGEHESPKNYNSNISDELNDFILAAIAEDSNERIKTAYELKRQWLKFFGKELPEEVKPAIDISESPKETEGVREEERIEEIPIVEEKFEPERGRVMEKPPPEPPPVLKEEDFVFVGEEERKGFQKPVQEKPVLEKGIDIEPDARLQHEHIELDLTAKEKPKQKVEDATRVIPFPVKPRGEPERRKALPFAIVGIGLVTLALGAFLILKWTQKSEAGKSKVETKKEVKVITPPPARPEIQVVEPEPAVSERPLLEEKKPLEEKKRPEEKKAGEKKREDKKKEEKIAAAKPPPPVEKPRCPEGMVFIPAGNFIIGSSGDDPLKDPLDRDLERAYTDEFCIDKYEYPNKKGRTPLYNVTWMEGKTRCEAEGKRLCSEEEWEKACKGPRLYKFPYGNEWKPNYCNSEDSRGDDRVVSSSGQWSRCESGYGVVDMSGNLREWISTRFSAAVGDMVVKGGSFTKPDWAVRCAVRYNMSPAAKDAETGFRCCSSTLR